MVLTAQQIYHLGECLESEAETVHTRVNLDVHGILPDAETCCLGYEAAQELDAVYLGFEAVVKEGLEIVDHRVEQDYGHRESLAAQLCALVVDGHGQICRSLGLEGLGELARSGSVARCLDHAYHSGGRLDERAEPVEIVDHGVKVYLEHGLVLTCLEHVAYEGKRLLGGSLDEDELVAEIRWGDCGKHLLDRLEGTCALGEERCVARYLLAYGDDTVYATLAEEGRRLAICPGDSLGGVCGEVSASHRLVPGSEAECQREGEAVDGILYVVVRGERYSEAPRGLSREIIICDFGTVPFLVNPADEEGGVRGLGRPSDAVGYLWYHR